MLTVEFCFPSRTHNVPTPKKSSIVQVVFTEGETTRINAVTGVIADKSR